MKKVFIYAVSLSTALLMFLVAVYPVFAESYGWSPDTSVKPPTSKVCTDVPLVDSPVLFQPNHPLLPKAKGKGEVRLVWTKVPGANNYNVYYGLSPKNYIYAAPDVGDSDNYTVKALANRTYYFAVQAMKGCAAGPLSNEWPGRPTYGGSTLAAIDFAPVQRQKVMGETTDTEPVYTPPEPDEDEFNAPASTFRPTAEESEQPSDIIPPAALPKPKGFLNWLLSLFGFGK